MLFRILPAFIGALIFLAAAFEPACAQTPALLILPDASGEVSQVLRLPLDIADADSAESGTIDVVFDSTVVRPRHESLEQGAFGASIQALWLANTLADTLRIVFATFKDGGYEGSGTLVTCEWELVGAGTSPLHFERIQLERDEQGTPIDLPATGEDGSIMAAPQPVEETTWGRVKEHYGGRGPSRAIWRFGPGFP